MSTRLVSVVSTALLLSVGCSSGAGPAETTDLAGSSWQLVKITSMDDSVVTPDERAKYTLTFEVGGQLTVRADCNRGRGGWSHTPPSGLELGPLATTRAACPPDSLHDRFLGDLSYVRSFVTREGHLFLATMADGAILEFAPFPEPSGPTFDCSAADGTVEELICDDEELAALDRKLDGLFQRALATFPEDEIDELKAFQRGWIKGRNACREADDARGCVGLSYRTRMTELEIQSGAMTVPEAVSYHCDGGESITAVFYADTALRAAVLTLASGEQVIAFRRPSASGAKYEGRNVTFWDKAGKAMATWDGRELRCTVH